MESTSLVPTPFLIEELHRPMNKETPYLHPWTNPTEIKNKMINQKIPPSIQSTPLD